jgi:hypothetical protein
MADTTPDRMAELLQRRAAREDAAAKAREARALEALELEDKFASEGKEPGVDFEVVTTTVGNFVVGNPDFIVAKQYLDKKTQTIEDTVRFVTPCILHPNRAEMGTVFQAHGGVAWHLAAACLRMHHGSEREQGGK